MDTDDTAGLTLKLKAEALPMRSRAAPTTMVLVIAGVVCVAGGEGRFGVCGVCMRVQAIVWQGPRDMVRRGSRGNTLESGCACACARARGVLVYTHGRTFAGVFW